MLIQVQKMKSDQRSQDEFLFKMPPALNTTKKGVYLISKRALCSAVQMLHSNESTTVLSDENCSLILRNIGGNGFSVTCSSRNGSCTALCSPELMQSSDLSNAKTDSESSSLNSLLRYISNQMLPLHSNGVKVSSNMQETFGFITNSIPASISYRRVDDTFAMDNATIISKLTDILNGNLQSYLTKTHLLQRQAWQQQRQGQRATKKIFSEPSHVYSASHAALQLQLAAIFCATALQDKTCMWHVSQGMMSDMSPEMMQSIYSAEPEKQHVTVLMKGDTVAERILRINLAVRYFSPEHMFTSTMMPSAMAMNASTCSTGVMVMTGVRNNIAAAIYVNSDSQTVLQQKIAFAAYMGV